MLNEEGACINKGCFLWNLILISTEVVVSESKAHQIVCQSCLNFDHHFFVHVMNENQKKFINFYYKKHSLHCINHLYAGCIVHNGATTLLTNIIKWTQISLLFSIYICFSVCKTYIENSQNQTKNEKKNHNQSKHIKSGQMENKAATTTTTINQTSFNWCSFLIGTTSISSTFVTRDVQHRAVDVDVDDNSTT